MKSSKMLLLALAMLSLQTVFAQKAKVVSGSLNAIKGQKELNIVFSYEGMAVGDFKKEQDYVDKKVKEVEKDKPGQGAKWAKQWEDQKHSIFEPKFEELFNKYIDGAIKLNHDNSAKYTLTVRTTFLEAGWNVGVMRKPASINVEYTITDDTGKPVYVMTMSKIPGADVAGFDFTGASRIKESYAKAGKELAKTIKKAMK